jgi:transposase
LLRSIRVPSIEEELQRQLSRARQQLVKERTRVMVQIRRRLYLFGYHQTHAKILQRRWVKEQIQSLSASSPLRVVIESQLKLWECVALEIKTIEAHLKQQASKCNLESVYRSVPGIGKVSSRILACELGDMKHFKNEKSLFSYVGMTPTENSSGEKIKRGHISRQGKPIIRKVLVEAAWSAIRRDAEIREYYKKLSSRTGGQRAVVAVGRKLIGRARALFRKGEIYGLHN